MGTFGINVQTVSLNFDWVTGITLGFKLIRALRPIGLTSKERNKAVNEISDVAEKASSWLWLQRSDSRWESSS